MSSTTSCGSPPGVSSLNPGLATPPSKWPENVRSWPSTLSVHVVYGSLPANVMSGRLESLTVLEIGWPPLNSSKWLPPTRRDTKIACVPEPVSSLHTTHGAAVPPGTSDPAATRGSSASWPGTAFREQASSASWREAQSLTVLPSVSTLPAVSWPTATHLNPPSAVGSSVAAGWAARAAKTCWVARRPVMPAPSSYQTTHGVVSSLPVKAMSGATPSRFTSMFSDGSSLFWPEARRLMPVGCQQKRLRLPQVGSLTPLETKIWSLSVVPSISFQATHGTGALPATAAPPAREGSSALLFVWMFTEGTWKPADRSAPSGIQFSATESKRLTKMFLTSPRWVLGSYQATHGTVRSGPAKSIDGAS